MIQALSERLSRFAHRWVPDPLILSVLLSFVTLITALSFGSQAPQALLKSWGGDGGLWKLLAFSMQMCLILVTGHALGVSPPVRAGIERLSALPQSARGAVMMTGLIAMIAGLINWGFGLIVGALLAREVGRSCERRGLAVHYPLLGAAGYAGMLVWHGGLSGSAPLKVTQLKDLAELSVGGGAITLDQTLWSGLNIGVNLALLVAVPLLLAWMSPLSGAVVPYSEVVTETSPAPQRLESSAEREGAAPKSPAERLEESGWLSRGLALLIVIYLALYISAMGVATLDLNSINAALLAVGLLAHPHLKAYAAAAQDAAAGCAGVILQFPLYAGVMGVMASAGLTGMIAGWVSSVASAESLSALVFLSAGLVNLFVPSGGGQWALQGPLIVESAQQLGAPVGEAVMAFSYGDAWTNMLQPFWALPLLGLTQLEARQIVGYSASLMLLVTPIYLLAFWLA